VSNKIDITSTALESMVDAARGFVERLAGPPAEELGLLAKDQISYWRFKNQVAILNKAKSLCEENNIHLKAISPKLLCPFLENAALEDDDYLQDRWAQLLASMVDSERNIQNHVFPYILGQLSKNEFIALEITYKKRLKAIEFDSFSDDYAPAYKDFDAYNADLSGVIKRDDFFETPDTVAEIEAANLIRLGLLRVKTTSTGRIDRFDHTLDDPTVYIDTAETLYLTELGIMLLDACITSAISTPNKEAL
jgi:hypothetical protein